MKIFLNLVSAGLGFFLVAAENPVLTMYPEEITFHLSYDQSSVDADMASGNWKAIRTICPAEFISGVFGGKALNQGCFYYMSKDNFHANQSGTLIAWVSPQDWPVPPPDMTRKEPGFGVFGGGLVMGKMMNHPGGKSAVHFTAQYSRSSKGVHISAEGNACQWKNKTWHMMAAVWDLSSIALSIDGQPLKITQISEKAPNHSMFSVGSRNNGGYHVAIDEVSVLNRKLSNEEIAALYRNALKIIKK